jgi:hypothetical protein
MKNVFFRLAFLFFTLYIVLNPNGFLPFVDEAFEIYIKPFHILVPWIGKHWLHLSYPITSFTNGSGDTTYDLVMYVLIFLLSVIGCVIWTLLDRRHPGYPVLHYWLIALVRYYFAFTMINYGFGKLFKLQFPFPGLFGLLETYGSSSPMRLAWSFFGYSPGYNYFMGFAEMASGLLLLSRRTLRIGAIISLVVAANIMAVNYSFDVCVKLLSTTLVIMAAYLLYQHREHHFNFFFRNRTVEPDISGMPVFKKRWLGRSLVVFKYLLIVFVIGGDLYGISKYMKEYGARMKPPLYGIYDVQTFVRNKDTLAPLTTDTVRWRKLIVSGTEYAGVRLMNDSSRTFTFKPDTVARKIVMTRRGDTTQKGYLEYALMGEDGMRLRGKWQGDSIFVTLKKDDINKFLLVNRGFHLVNETPFNR